MTMIATALTRRLTALPRITMGAILPVIFEADRRYRDKRSLQRLDDHMLRDMGLTDHRTRQWDAAEHLVRKWS
jgi:uncharacterized protein YjiS (DUF1127 family)